MSGSTRVTQARELYTLTLETPCISFAPGPIGPDGQPHPDEQSQEQRYHSAARERFEAQLAPLDPGLGQALAAIRARSPELGLVPWSEALQLVVSYDDWALQRYRDAGGGPCRLSLRAAATSGPGEGIDGTLELAFSTLPAKEAADALRDEVAAEVGRLLRAARPPETPGEPAQAAPPPPAGTSLVGLLLAFALGTALATGALLLLGR